MKPGDDRPPGWLTLVACLAAVPLGIGVTNGWWSAWWLLYAPALILLVGVLVIGCTTAIRLLSWWYDKPRDSRAMAGREAQRGDGRAGLRRRWFARVARRRSGRS